MNRKLFFALASLAFITGLGITLCLFRVSIFGHHDDGYGDSVAQAKAITNDVQRKASDSLTWRNLRAGDDLYLNDSVITGNNSTCDVVFHAGHFLNIGPNTLIQIKPPEKPELPITLVLNSGQYQIRLAKEDKIQLNDLTVRFAQPSLVIVSRNSENLRVELVEGRAEIVDKITGTSVQSLALGSPLVMNEPQSITPVVEKAPAPIPAAKKSTSAPVKDNTRDRIKNKITGPKITMRMPEPGYRARAHLPLKISWEANPQAEVYSWEISRDPDFNQIVDSGETFETSKAVSNLPEGKLFWRVNGRDEDGILIGEDEIWAVYIEERKPASKDVSTHDIPVSDIPKGQSSGVRK